MKKGILIIFCAIVSIFSLFSMSKKNKNIEVNGYIKIYGNDPFTYIGIKTLNDEIYMISTTKEISQDLSLNQGKLIGITGELSVEKGNNNFPLGAKDGTIILESWSVVE